MKNKNISENRIYFLHFINFMVLYTEKKEEPAKNLNQTDSSPRKAITMILLTLEKSKLFFKNDRINFSLHIKCERLDLLIKEYEETLNFEYIKCPTCGCTEFVGYGTYKRNIVINNINKKINIKRVKCKHCNHTHALIPSFIKPYYVYESSYIDFCVLLMLIRDKKKRELEHLLNISRQLLRKWELKFYKHKMYIMTTFKLKELREVINKLFESNFTTEYMYQNGMRYFS